MAVLEQHVVKAFLAQNNTEINSALAAEWQRSALYHTEAGILATVFHDTKGAYSQFQAAPVARYADGFSFTGTNLATDQFNRDMNNLAALYRVPAPTSQQEYDLVIAAVTDMSNANVDAMDNQLVAALVAGDANQAVILEQGVADLNTVEQADLDQLAYAFNI